MRKIAAAVISAFLALVLLPSCSEDVASSNDSSASADTTGQKETAATPKTEQEPDEEELYYYNPKLTKCYRKNDNTILFTLVVMGGSMGGQASLIYTIDGRHTVDVCVAHCPCYNTIECFLSHEAFPRAFISAVNDYNMPLDKALKLISPEHRTNEMPDIPYLITADEFDEVFPINGIERYAESVKNSGHDVTYMRLENQKHGGISSEDRDTMNTFIFRQFGIKA